MRNFDKPFALMIPEGLSGWGEWTVSPLETKKVMAGIALSQGGALTMGHVALPCGAYAGKVADGVVNHSIASSRSGSSGARSGASASNRCRRPR